MKQLLEKIKSQLPLTAVLEQAVLEAFVQKEVKRNTLLLREGQYCRDLFFLEKGTLRTFYYHEGKDVTSWIYKEGQFCTAWYSFLKQEPSFEYIEILEDSTVYSISNAAYQQLFQEFPKFERFGRKMMEEQTAFLDYFYKGYLFLSAKERYKLLLSFIPDVEQRMKLGHIASFLGISQETLSRIRTKP